MRYVVRVSYGSTGGYETLYESDNWIDAKQNYLDEVGRNWCVDGPSFDILDNQTGHEFRNNLWFNYKDGISYEDKTIQK